MAYDVSAYNRTYRLANIEKIRVQRKKHRIANREKIAAYGKSYRQAHTEKAKAEWKIYYQANKDKLKARNKAYYLENPEKIKTVWKKYRQANLEKRRVGNKTYYQFNTEKEKIRAKAYRQTNPEVLRLFNRKRKALKRGASHESYTDNQIFERDGYICQLCGNRINMKLKHPNSLSASIDHIIPISKGGADAPMNIQAAHLGCNMVKHAGAGGQLRLFG